METAGRDALPLTAEEIPPAAEALGLLRAWRAVSPLPEGWSRHAEAMPSPERGHGAGSRGALLSRSIPHHARRASRIRGQWLRGYRHTLGSGQARRREAEGIAGAPWDSGNADG